MGTAVRCFFFTIYRQNTIAVALCCMLMDTLGHKGIAVLCVFMGTGNFRCPFGITAGAVMLGVVFAQPGCVCNLVAVLCACFGKCHCREHGHDHAQADKRRK